MTGTSTNSAPAVVAGRIEIRPAGEADNDGLLALTKVTPMGGTIALRIDRDPDFFALLRMRGESVVYVAVRGREVVGCISAALRTAYIAGVPETTAYVGDMKVHPRFSGSRVALRLIQALEAYLRSAGIDLCFSVVADGNQRAMPLFEGRLGIPRWVPLGRFLVDEFAPSPFKGSSGRYSIETAQASALPAIVELLDRFHRSRQFAPRLAEDESGRALSNQSEEPFPRTLVALSGSNVVATLTLCDASAAKRNVLLNAPPLLRGALTFLRVAAVPFPGFRVPRMGDSLKLLSVRYAACEDGHALALKALLKFGQAEVFRHRYTFLSLGLHERDPLRSLVSGIPKFSFSSLGFATSLTSPGRLARLAEGVPFEDFALV
jgi:ribosomal protein S18 acetylase RimI-like enzyme